MDRQIRAGSSCDLVRQPLNLLFQLSAFLPEGQLFLVGLRRYPDEVTSLELEGTADGFAKSRRQLTVGTLNVADLHKLGDVPLREGSVCLHELAC
ncbi:MAG: hypothetical protein GTN78_20580, partial [Gemmatimonadales bacterium]|nr:hypothetical protein [Gemmatimonadales bacterium]